MNTFFKLNNLHNKKAGSLLLALLGSATLLQGQLLHPAPESQWEQSLQIIRPRSIHQSIELGRAGGRASSLPLVAAAVLPPPSPSKFACRITFHVKKLKAKWKWKWEWKWELMKSERRF
ncbi:hypothetical protein SDJN03_06575, partial [Cucurbita argyrosperma subsp. sororia]